MSNQDQETNNPITTDNDINIPVQHEIKQRENITTFVLTRLKLWSLLILPLFGFAIGKVIQYFFCNKDNWRYGALITHIITMFYMIITLNDLVLNVNENIDVKDKLLFICVSYLFVIGVVFGICIN